MHMIKELYTGRKKWLLLTIAGLLFGTVHRASAQQCNASFKTDIVGNIVTFQDTSTNLFQSSYLLQWEFGDSTYAINNKTPSHTYAHPGVHEVKLIISSQSPYCYDSVVKKITVGSGPVPPCQAKFTYTSHYKTKKALLKRFISTGDSLIWNLGSTERSDTDFLHVFGEMSPFKPIRLTLKNNGCIDSSSVYLFRNIPLCEVDFDFMRSDESSDSFQFFQSGISTSWLEQAELEWDFGDGSKSTGTTPGHRFVSPGENKVCLEIKDDDIGCIVRKCQIVKTCEARFETVINTDNGYGHTFKSTSIGKNLTYKWGIEGISLKDSTITQPSVVLPGEGNYKVKLIIKDGTICTDTLEKEVQVPLGRNGCLASFTTGINGDSVEFTNTSITSGPTLRYFWRFGDGSTSTKVNPAHAYLLKGDYPITLRVSNFEGSCKDSAEASVQILEDQKTCRAKFQLAVDTTLKYTLFAFDQSIEARQYEWNFGDGNVSNIHHPRHDYESVGQYTLCVTIQGQDGSCTDTYCDSFLVDTSGKIGWKKGFTLVILPSSVLNANSATEEKVEIYPIPFKDVLHVATSMTNGKITAYDISGKSMGFEIPIPENEAIIETTHWPPGLYVIRIQNEQTSTNYKIIKH